MNYQELICKLNNSTYYGQWSTKEMVGVNIIFNGNSIFEIFKSGQFQMYDLSSTSSNMDNIIVRFLNQPKEKWFEGVNYEA